MSADLTERDPPLYFRLHVFCCTNERAEGHPRGSCKRRGSEALRDYMKKRAKQEGLEGIRINASGCLDRCELGPTMVIYPEGIWYSFHSEADVEEIIARHLKKGERVERLLLPPDTAAG
ncbi:(2Fe-2S) ferredoxin domain-containing protein [Zavarzinia sp. CC-PAN008]|uniref:(2Fe-2S) ferredoxin domain-containing protein n=1 Tax=Zavarzinia sp. CC-PAN008 TaxID=3243332 RepID=UPI003F74944C